MRYYHDAIRGFSLIEMMVGLCLSALLASFVFKLYLSEQKIQNLITTVEQEDNRGNETVSLLSYALRHEIGNGNVIEGTRNELLIKDEVHHSVIHRYYVSNNNLYRKDVDGAHLLMEGINMLECHYHIRAEKLVAVEFKVIVSSRSHHNAWYGFVSLI